MTSPAVRSNFARMARAGAVAHTLIQYGMIFPDGVHKRPRHRNGVSGLAEGPITAPLSGNSSRPCGKGKRDVSTMRITTLSVLCPIASFRIGSISSGVNTWLNRSKQASPDNAVDESFRSKRLGPSTTIRENSLIACCRQTVECNRCFRGQRAKRGIKRSQVSRGDLIVRNNDTFRSGAKRSHQHHQNDSQHIVSAVGY